MVANLGSRAMSINGDALRLGSVASPDVAETILAQPPKKPRRPVSGACARFQARSTLTPARSASRHRLVAGTLVLARSVMGGFHHEYSPATRGCVEKLSPRNNGGDHLCHRVQLRG